MFYLASLPDNYRSLLTDGQPFVREIVVQEAKDSEAGYADNTHPYHVRAGNWERIWRGIYRLRHYPSPEDGDKVAWYLWSRGRDSAAATLTPFRRRSELPPRLGPDRLGRWPASAG